MGELPKITPKMLQAGLNAYRRWNAVEEEVEAMLAAVFFSMATAMADVPTPALQELPESGHLANVRRSELP
jgi:hypothetical protein